MVSDSAGPPQFRGQCGLGEAIVTLLNLDSTTADEVIAVYDPSTGEQIGQIADGGERAVDEAVGRARESFENRVWLGKTPSERSRILYKVADLIEQLVLVDQKRGQPGG